MIAVTLTYSVILIYNKIIECVYIRHNYNVFEDPDLDPAGITTQQISVAPKVEFQPFPPSMMDYIVVHDSKPG